jgi:type IX secretion system PorP/SprF family membrane protein
MRKPLLFLVFFIMGAGLVFAQQKPQYTQYVFNNILLNPAVSGIENYTDIKAGYRSQWTGLAGAPVTSYITISAPLGNKFIYGDANELPTAGNEDPAARSYVQQYQAAEPHHGIGFTLVSDKAGPITETNIDATYAYHIGLTSNFNLALGVAAGVSRTNLNTSGITTEIPNDPAINNANSAKWLPDLSLGIWGYSGAYYFGVSVQQVLPQTVHFGATSVLAGGKLVPLGSKTVPHYFFTAGYKLFLSDDLTLLPSIMIKEISPVPLTYDVNMKLSFKDVFWLGGSYRRNDSFGLLLGININSVINVGYSYDITTSELNTVSNGTHEIVLGILLNNRYNVRNPQRTF